MTKVWVLIGTWLQLDFFSNPDSEKQSSSTLTTTIFTQSFIALLFAALIFDTDVKPVAFAAANLSLSTVLIGMSVIADQENHRRRMADHILLGTAPISRFVLPLARALHAGFHICLITTGMALAPAILCYWVNDHWLGAVLGYLVLASLLAGLLAATFHLGIRILLRTLGPNSAWLIVGSMRGVLLAGLVLAMATCLPHLSETAADLPMGRSGALAWPPYWGARLLAHPIDDAFYGLAILALGAALYLAFALLGDGERIARKQSSGKNNLFARLEKRLAHRGPLLGVTAFVANMLYRSPGFRARVLPLFGLPLAMALLAFSGEQDAGSIALLGVCLQFPAIYLPFLILFLPQGDHEASSWMFETSPHHSVAIAREASFIAISSRILLPVHAIAAALMMVGGLGPITVISLATFSWGIAVLLASFQLRTLQCIPFTVEGESLEGGMEFGGLIGLGIVLAFAGTAFGMIAKEIFGLCTGLSLTALALFRLHKTPSRCYATK